MDGSFRVRLLRQPRINLCRDAYLESSTQIACAVSASRAARVLRFPSGFNLCRVGLAIP